MRRAALAAALCTTFARFALAETPTDAPSETATTPDARHASTPSVAIVASPPDSAVVPLLRAELRAAGLTVVDAAEPSRAEISLHVTFTGESLEVSVVDEATGQTTLRELFTQKSDAPMDARTAVLHAVELLHWHLSPRETPAALPAKPPPPSMPRMEKANGNVHLDATFLALTSYSPGGTTPGIGAQLDVLCRWQAFGVRALGGTLLAPSRLDGSAGSIRVTPRWAGLVGTWVSPETRSGTALEVGAGAALLQVALHGTPGTSTIGGDDTPLSVGALGDLRARQRLTHGFALTLGASALVPLESDRLRMLDREVGRYGQVVATFGLGFEVELL